jgi:hypothetical protein
MLVLSTGLKCLIKIQAGEIHVAALQKKKKEESLFSRLQALSANPS